MVTLNRWSVAEVQSEPLSNESRRLLQRDVADYFGITNLSEVMCLSDADLFELAPV